MAIRPKWPLTTHPSGRILAMNIMIQIKDKKSAGEANSKNPADENNIIEDDEDYGKVDMAEVFPNTDDNPIEYIYTRDSTGRAISVDFRLKVPRNEVEFIRSHDENGGIVDVECRLKKTGEDDTTTGN